MIVYFSATGNSKYAAQRIAEALGEKTMSIEEGVFDITLEEDEHFGIVTPTHWWALPIPVRAFLKKLNLKRSGRHYVFVVSTYGTTPGCSGEETRRLLKEKGIRLSAAYNIKMPDNWTVTFDLSNPKKVARQNEKAEVNIDRTIAKILHRKKGNYMNLKTPYAIYPLTDKVFAKVRSTKNLSVEDSCIGCGLCAEKCPVKAIRIKDGKPVWVRDRCALCFRCLHHCPEFAIQFWNGATKKHGQYTNPNVKI
jgi:ferredoxin